MPEGEKKSNLPLDDLFKSMKTAFAVKCPSHSGEVKKSPPGGKKSVDFLANSLMERAVAKSFSPVCNTTSPSSSTPSSLTTTMALKHAALSLPSRPSTPTSEPELNIEIKPPPNTANHEATLEPIHSEPTQGILQNPETATSNFSVQFGVPSKPTQITPPPPLNSTAKQTESSGLAMIGACYCSSSDDEL